VQDNISLFGSKIEKCLRAVIAIVGGNPFAKILMFSGLLSIGILSCPYFFLTMLAFPEALVQIMDLLDRVNIRYSSGSRGMNASFFSSLKFS
jgi:hypothetical protein